MAGSKILLVEDDEDIGMLISHTLRSVGYQVTWAKDGIHALTSAKIAPPDLIVSDFMFPAGGGATFFQRLRMAPQTQSAPIIILSAVPKELIAAAVAPNPITYYLPKPYKKAELLSLVEGVLQGSSYPSLLLNQTPSPAAAPAPKPSRGTVLVIAEAKEDRAALRWPLEEKNFKVVEAVDSAEAVSLLGLDAGSASPDALRPGLIVIDGQTDLGSGHVINARLMREPSTRSIPVLVMTAKKEMRAAFFDASNVSAFLDKPIDPARLLRHAEELIPVKGS
jgi:CheY-like chemotaxis protein